jgi:hypothetical protein
VEPADYELKDVNANRFVKFADHYLFLGGSTGPDGGDFVVFDLKSKQKVYQHVYIGRDMRVSGNTITYMQSLGRARRDQCKDYDKIVKQGLSPTIDAGDGVSQHLEIDCGQGKARKPVPLPLRWRGLSFTTLSKESDSSETIAIDHNLGPEEDGWKDGKCSSSCPAQ